MNLIDAIKSGKRFRRSSWHALRDWVRPISNMCLSIPVDDILADDWEIEQTSVTITRDQLLRAYIDAGKTDDVKHGRIDLIHATMKQIGLY